MGLAAAKAKKPAPDRARSTPAAAPGAQARRPPPLLQRKGCACGGGCPSCRAATKPDPLEAQAEAAATRVMRAPQPGSPPVITAAEAEPARMPEDESLAIAEPPAAALATGAPLPPDLRNFFEPRFGRNLAAVRLHTGTAAGRSARDFGARAYTWGRDIAFAPGEYRPDSAAGRQLIAHEIAHVAQQGRAPMQGAATAQAPPRLQRACGPIEVGAVTGCEAGSGQTFGTPILFNVNCDTLTPEGEATLVAIGELVRGETVNVHGYASEEGDPAFNHNLSCLRAYTVAMRLQDDYGVLLGQAFEHGPVPGERAQRRAVSVEPVAPARPPVVIPIPTQPAPVQPQPGPAPPAPINCGTLHAVAAALLNVDENVVTETFECACGIMKIGDILNSVIPMLPKSAERAIEISDCLCGFWDWLQLIWEVGCEHAPCWNPMKIDAAGWARIVAFAALLGVDCFVDNLDDKVNDVITWIEVKIAEGAIAHFDLPAFLADIAIAELMKALVKSWGELAIDLGIYFAQNELTHGTPFPLDGCRSCFRLPYYFGLQDYSWVCETINAALPDIITIPDWHGAPSDGGWGDGPEFWGPPEQ